MVSFSKGIPRGEASLIFSAGQQNHRHRAKSLRVERVLFRITRRGNFYYTRRRGQLPCRAGPIRSNQEPTLPIEGIMAISVRRGIFAVQLPVCADLL
jgi:hypothetical protein